MFCDFKTLLLQMKKDSQTGSEEPEVNPKLFKEKL